MQTGSSPVHSCETSHHNHCFVSVTLLGLTPQRDTIYALTTFIIHNKFTHYHSNKFI